MSGPGSGRVAAQASDSTVTGGGRRRAETPPETVPGKNRLGPYAVRGRLGRGGLGVVYDALDTRLRRRVALKMVASPALATELRGRLVLEALAAARLNHPNVVTVYEIGEHGGTPYIAMELLAGGSVQARLKKLGVLPWREATRIARDACRGLQAAHAAGLIHRDVKPGNLLLTPDGTVKVGDFGLVKMSDQTAAGLTGDNAVVGTPHYMSPEQCCGEPLDARSDLYSLGATYYCLLTGRPPFPVQPPMRVLLAHCTTPAPDPRTLRPDLPAACAEVTRKALAKEPTQRYQSAAAMLADLEQMLADAAGDTERCDPVVRPGDIANPAPTPHRRRFLRGALAAVTGCGAVSAGYALWPRAPGTSASPVAAGPPPFHGLIGPGGLTFRLRGEVGGVLFSPDGRWFAACASDRDGGGRLWDCRTGAERELPWAGEQVRGCAFSPDGTLLAAGWQGGRGLRLYRLADGHERLLHPTPNGNVRALAFTPDGQWLAVGLDPWGPPHQFLWLVPLTPGAAARPLAGTGAPVGTLAVSPDGTHLAAGADDGTVRLFHLPSGDVAFELGAGRPRGSPPLAFAPDGRWLAVAAGPTVSFWDVGTGRERPTRLRADAGFSALAVNRNNRLVASANHVEVFLWDAGTGERLETVGEHAASVFGLAFSPDGLVLASGSHDGTARLRDVTHFATAADPRWRRAGRPR